MRLFWSRVVGPRMNDAVVTNVLMELVYFFLFEYSPQAVPELMSALVMAFVRYSRDVVQYLWALTRPLDLAKERTTWVKKLRDETLKTKWK